MAKGPATEPRRLTPKGEATRARIIELASDMFAREGYGAASIRDLADRSGLSSGAIYGTFRSKAELLAEAVDALIASDEASLPSSVIEQMSLPDIDAYQYENVTKRDRFRALLLEAAVAARTDPDVQERLNDAVAPHIEMATDAHDEWKERAGVDRELDMRALVMLLWSADLGLAVLDAMGFDRPDPHTWAELMRRLLKSLETPGAEPGAPSPRPTKRRRAR
jgi:AcrR family transcriptional regulator